MIKYAWFLPFLMFSGACGDCSSTTGNQAPTLDDASFVTPEDTPREISTEALDPDGDALTYTWTTPTHGTLAGTPPSLTYTPAADYVGEDSFELTASDGALSVTATIHLTVEAVNDAPAAADDSASTTEGADVVIPAADLLANDVDVDTATLVITSVADAIDGSVSLVGTDITFSPTPGFAGNATFTYTVSDGTLTDTATVTVVVDAVNDGPVALDDTSSTNEDVPLTIPTSSLLANDSDVDGPSLTITSVQDALGGTVSLANDEVTFTPGPDTSGSASFTYTVSDGSLTANATVAVTVNAVNDAPVAAADAFTGTEDQEIFVDAAWLLGNDLDIDGPFVAFVSADNAVNGTLAYDANGVTFTPDAEFSGSASFDYVITDGTLTASASVQLTVEPANDAPVANQDSATTSEDVALVLSESALLANDIDVDGPSLAIVWVGNATGGSVQIAGSTLTFTPTPDGNGPAAFDYQVSDGALSAFATVFVDVTAVNDPPVASDETYTITNDQDLVVAADTLLANDADVDGPLPLVLTSVWDAVNGTVALGSGTVTFTPSAGFVGTASFGYTISDGVDTDFGHVTVTVQQANRAPVAANQFYDIRVNTAITITLAATDADGDGLTYTVFSQPAHGTLSGSGAVYTYSPSLGYVGTDSFGFRANDGQADSNDATVDLTISVPVCGDSTVDTAELCDDGNLVAGDGCRADCRGVEICGDGWVDSIVGEQCDDGNTTDGDGCSSTCLLPAFANIAPVVISGSLSCDTNNSNAGRKAAVDALGRIYVAMNCGGTGYVSVSADRGFTWPGPVSTGVTGVQILAVEGGPTGVAYVVAKTSANEVVFTRTTDGGVSWETPRTLATGITDAEVSIDSLADEVYVAVRSGTGLSVLRNFSRGAGSFDAVAVAQVNTFHDVIIDKISGNVILGSDNPAFRVRISDDQGSTFGAESTPPGSAYYSDWAGSNGYLYVTGTNGDDNIDRIPLSAPSTSTQVTGLPTNVSFASVRSIDADALGNAYVVSQLTTGNIQLDRMTYGATSILSTDARTIAAGTFPTVAALPSNNGALIAYTSGTTVYGAVVVYP